MAAIFLINPNTSARTLAMMLDAARPHLPDGVSIQGAHAATGVPMIVTAADLEQSVAEVLRLGQAAGPEITAIIIAAFGDPGLAALRATALCKVIGIGEAAIRAAAAGGRRFGIATTTPGLVRAIEAKVAALSLTAQFTGVRVSSLDPRRLAADPGRQERELALCVDACIARDGAQVVVIGGGPLSDTARALHARFGAAVIEPIPAAIHHALRFCRP